MNCRGANSTSYNCSSDSIFAGLDIDEYLAIIFKRLQGCRPQGCRWRLRRSCGHTELSLASRKFFYSVRNTKNQLNAILLINMDYWGAAHSQEGLSQLPWKFQIYLMTPRVLSGVGLIFGYDGTPVLWRQMQIVNGPRNRDDINENVGIKYHHFTFYYLVNKVNTFE